MKKSKVSIAEKDLQEWIRIPEWYNLPYQWTDCIKPNIYLGKQRPCQNKKCASEHCNRARNSQQFLFLLINYSINPPDYFIVLKFTPESDLLSECEWDLILKHLRQKIRHISKYPGKRHCNPTFSFDSKVEFDNGQSHLHMTLTFKDETHGSNCAGIVKEKLEKIFHKTVASLQSSGKLISEVQPAPVYFESLRNIQECARYLAKAEDYLSKHEPVPSNYSRKRKRLYSCSRDHQAISKRELAQLKKDLWANKLALKNSSALSNESCNLKPKMQETPINHNQKFASTQVDSKNAILEGIKGHNKRMMNVSFMPVSLFRTIQDRNCFPCLDLKPANLKRGRFVQFASCPFWLAWLLKKDHWVNKLVMRESSVFSYENRGGNLQPRVHGTTINYNKKIASTEVDSEAGIQARSMFSHKRMMNTVFMPWFLFKKLQCRLYFTFFDMKPVTLKIRHFGKYSSSTFWFVWRVYDVQFLE